METIDSNTYTLIELFSDLNTSIIRKDNPDVYSRNLQRNYVEQQIKLADSKSFEKTDVSAVARGNLNSIKKELAAKTDENTINKYHYEDLVFRIEKALDPK